MSSPLVGCSIANLHIFLMIKKFYGNFFLCRGLIKAINVVEVKRFSKGEKVKG